MAFAIHLSESVTRIHVSPHPKPPLTSFLLGCPRALAFGALLSAPHLHWSSILYTVLKYRLTMLSQAGINIAGRTINNLRYADDATFMAESKELRSLLMKVKEESEKTRLKLNIQKTKIMASSPITLWQIDRETMKAVTDFIFLGSKITADGDYSKEIKTLDLWKKSYDQPRQHIKKQRHYFANKVRLVKAMVCPVVMYGCQSWTIRKAEHQRIDAFELWCWIRLFRGP